MNTKLEYKCLIVEDEPIAAEVLKDYITEINWLHFAGICKDALFALDQMQQERVDVLFLDIHLPKLKGLDFIQIMPYRPQIILTTAYHQYTLDAFEIGVTDYLMKPIAFSRFLKAINKLKIPQTHHLTSQQNQRKESLVPRSFHFFNVNKKMIRIYFDEILYVESLKDYSRIHTLEKGWVTRGSISQMEKLFSGHHFIRIHRSYLVPIARINAYSAAEVELKKQKLPIGRSYKEIVAQTLREYFQKN